MTKESQLDAAAKALTPSFAGAERMMEMTQVAMARAIESPQRLIEANLEAGAEIFAFMSRRMQAQADFWQKLAKCHAAEDAICVQREFATGLTKDYTAEATLIAEKTAGLAQENFRKLTEQMEDVRAEALAATPVKVAQVA
ncbi:phasin family protein [Rhodobacteraceae bacterium DSL-40]|uniref:phasin family protein n=1 Tax=Amaricoccus sp. B4 TaxID=3368557 RepID=UPI000DADCFC7